MLRKIYPLGGRGCAPSCASTVISSTSISIVNTLSSSTKSGTYIISIIVVDNCQKPMENNNKIRLSPKDMWLSF